MNKKIVFATNNRHKLDEIRSILGASYTIVPMDEIGCSEDIPETADTLEGNALLKAQYIKTHYGYDCFADDTGLEVKALNNAPGVYSARYAGESKDPKANMRKVIKELENQTDRSARFRTVIALLLGEKEYLFEGIVEGKLIEEARGNAGFGYDPVFVPEGFMETFAEMGVDVKNKISHRAKAVEQLKKFLDEKRLD
ncbi:MAG: non-canonical purine NTP diphosphatase [Dysgonamonadaceae bacterium]|jgi:XTP/dITP diphosphohydrolase|nr:non-canonical purine NTP diphosphatase [Dysgonamonadaceae bacterium]